MGMRRRLEIYKMPAFILKYIKEAHDRFLGGGISSIRQGICQDILNADRCPRRQSGNKKGVNRYSFARRVGLSAVLATLIAGTLRADDSSAVSCVFDDRGDKLSIGHARIGDPQQLMPSGAQRIPDECFETAQGEVESCAYRASDGVTYIVHGTEVWQKEIRDLFSYSGTLIADIEGGDSILDVIGKLNSLPKNFPAWKYWKLSPAGFVIGTEPCLRSSNGAIWDYRLEFNEQGLLTSVSSSSTAYWDVHYQTQ